MAGRILIADDQATNRLTLRVALAQARYEVAVAETARDAIGMISSAQPDLLIIGDRMRDAEGPELLRRIRTMMAGADPSILLLTDASDPESRVQALIAGADDVLTRPFDEVALMARVRNLMRARETGAETARRRKAAGALGFAEAASDFAARGRIGLVSADRELGSRLREGLLPHLGDDLVLMSADAALDEGGRANPTDVFVIDADVSRPGGGLTLLADLRSRPGTRHAAMIFAHRAEDAGHGATALDLGASDLFDIDNSPEELAVRLTRQLRRKRAADKLRRTEEDGLRLAATDPLTGLYNRRYAQTYLHSVWREAAVKDTSFAVMVADIDHFKAINDRYGHTNGDAVLKATARTIRDGLRGQDMVARIGGEEFLIVMPDTDFSRARPAAERLCRMIAGTPVRLDGGHDPVVVTVSIGVSIGGIGERSEPAALISNADSALYRAKAEGRNKVDMFQPAA